MDYPAEFSLNISYNLNNFIGILFGQSCSKYIFSKYLLSYVLVINLKARLIWFLADTIIAALGHLFFFFLINLFIYFWQCWVFVAARGLSLVVASGGYSSLRCSGFSLRWLFLLRSTDSRLAGFSSRGTQAQ